MDNLKALLDKYLNKDPDFKKAYQLEVDSMLVKLMTCALKNLENNPEKEILVAKFKANPNSFYDYLNTQIETDKTVQDKIIELNKETLKNILGYLSNIIESIDKPILTQLSSDQ